jgi:asparagine synthase (glutamine-hydrolysing)
VSYFWWSASHVRSALYSEDFAAELAGGMVVDPLLATMQTLPPGMLPLDRMLHLEQRHFLADHNLNYTDKMAMASGVEVRVPLLDIDLVEYAATIPARLKQEGRTGKAILRKAMQPLLPRPVIDREKMGFGAPLRRWLRTDLRPLLEDTLSPEALQRRGIFDAAAVQRFIKADRAGMVDGSYIIFSMLCMELWCRLFLDVPARTRSHESNYVVAV